MPVHRNTLRLAACLLLSAGLCGPAAAAEDGPFPRLEGEISVELQNDYTVQSDDSDAEINDAYTTIEPGFSARFTPELSLETSFVFEPVQDPDPGDDRFFEDHGLYAEEIYLNYETDRFAAYGGKFNPTFGTAWDLAPGVYGTDFAEDYEITERIGLGAALKFGGGADGDGFGEHRLAVNTFFADTTFLSESAITRRGELDHADGGPSNTEDPSSLSATLDGGGFPGLPVDYHLGFQFQEGGPGTPEDQIGYVAGLRGSVPLGPEVTLEPLVENAYLENFGGVAEDRNYATAGAALLYGRWNAALSYTNRHVDPAGAASYSDDHIQLSAGYAFDSGVTVDLGYKYTEDNTVDAHVVGLLVSYSFGVALPQ